MSHYQVAVSLKTYGDVSVEQETLGREGSVRGVHIEGVDPAELARVLVEADALIVTNDTISAASIDALPGSVQLIVRGGSGLDAIDLLAAQRRGIAVANTPGYATDEVAGHALAMILSCARSLGPADLVARSTWNWREVPMPLRLADTRLGIVGGGRIGSRVAEMARNLLGEVSVFDPWAQPKLANVTRVDTLGELLASSDIVSLHVALSESTYHLLDEDALRTLPRGARVVNSSRGGLVDEAALDRLVRNGHIACAALDVLELEPPGPASPTTLNGSIALSPHIAWASPSSGARARAMATTTALEFLSGAPLTCGALATEAGTAV